MKKFSSLLLVILIIVIPILSGMAFPAKMTDAREKKAVIRIETEPNLEIHEGYVSQKEETVLVKKGRKTIARVYLSEPVVVAQAEQEEKWGYFQFPSIGKAEDGTLIVSWQMKDDSPKTYGVKSEIHNTPMMSKDGGRTWLPQDKEYERFVKGYNVVMSDGSKLQVNTPKAKDIKSYNTFPRPVVKEENGVYFLENSLPKDLQGVYFNYQKPGEIVKTIHATLNDPGLVRAATDNLLPVVWWGNIEQLKDLSLVAGVYPCDYFSDGGGLIKGCVSFYRSTDYGKSWTVIGKILPDSTSYARKSKWDEDGFSEPAFEIIADSTFICVMRTGMTAPMYRSFSYDLGSSWTKTEAFTPNGVKPKLLKLSNGILVLASGRPGIQLRFSVDGKGRDWTEPIEMMPYMNGDGSFTRDVSCGYASLLKEGEDSFYLVYSDFNKQNKHGEIRKSILCRKISIKK